MSVDSILKQAEKLTSEDRAELLERLGRNGKTAGVDSANGSVGVAERSYGLLGGTGGLLSGDALILAVMQTHGLTHLASNDADFDRVPGIVRYGPV